MLWRDTTARRLPTLPKASFSPLKKTKKSSFTPLQSHGGLWYNMRRKGEKGSPRQQQRQGKDKEDEDDDYD
jgi:hypothetical protein